MPIEDLPLDVISGAILSRNDISCRDFVRFVRTNRSLWKTRFDIWDRLTRLVIDVSYGERQLPLPRSLRRLKVVDGPSHRPAHLSDTPLDLTNCVKLEHLDCSGCTDIRKLPLIPVSLTHLDCLGCVNLKDTIVKQDAPNLQYLGCSTLPRNIYDHDGLDVLESLTFPSDITTVKNEVNIPFEDWFPGNSGSCLPFIALQNPVRSPVRYPVRGTTRRKRNPSKKKQGQIERRSRRCAMR
jgi:hypothetical protein